MTEKKAIIFTDGACSGNPGPGGWGAIISLPSGEVQELGGQKDLTTNNQMEISAILFALEFLVKKILSTSTSTLSIIQIITDSQYAVSGLKDWRKQWKTRAWTNMEGAPIANQVEWQKLDEIVENIFTYGIGIDYTHIPGHSRIAANERCDIIAQSFAQRKKPSLFVGKISDYSVSLEIPSNIAERAAWRSKLKKGGGYYLSYVNGKISRHTTWAECEALVKGRVNAKFKKCASLEHEKEILRDWGISKNQD